MDFLGKLWVMVSTKKFQAEIYSIREDWKFKKIFCQTSCFSMHKPYTNKLCISKYIIH